MAGCYLYREFFLAVIPYRNILHRWTEPLINIEKNLVAKKMVMVRKDITHVHTVYADRRKGKGRSNEYFNEIWLSKKKESWYSY